MPNDPIKLELAMVCCPHHGEVFRAMWPSWYPNFAALAFGLMGRDPFAWGYVGRPRDVGNALKARPLCCRAHDISPDVLHALYLRCGVGVADRCCKCDRAAMGFPFRGAVCRSGPGVADAGVGIYSHVCFSCWLTRFKPSMKGAFRENQD